MTTAEDFCNHFVWTTLSADIEILIHSFTHCTPKVGRGKVPLAHGPIVHVTTANDLLEFQGTALPKMNVKMINRTAITYLHSRLLHLKKPLALISMELRSLVSLMVTFYMD